MTSRIVLGKDLESGKVREFLEYGNEEITYRNFKIRVRRWGKKYGPYNTIKQQAGEARFVDGGKIKYNVEVINVIEELDYKSVGVGYGNVDSRYL